MSNPVAISQLKDILSGYSEKDVADIDADSDGVITKYQAIFDFRKISHLRAEGLVIA